MHTNLGIHHGGKERTETTSARKEANGGSAHSLRKASTLKSISLFVAPSVLFLALAASSTYTQLRVSESLTSLETRFGQLVEAQTARSASVDGTGEDRLPNAAVAQSAASSEKLDDQSKHLGQIEETLSALTESVSLLSAQVASTSVSASPRRLPALPTLPVLPSPSFGPDNERQPQAEANVPVSNISDESRMEANEILRDYAELARAEIDAAHEAGKLDHKAMERIKRETRMQAEAELQSRLPSDVLEEMFPMGLDEPGI